MQFLWQCYKWELVVVTTTGTGAASIGAAVIADTHSS